MKAMEQESVVMVEEEARQKQHLEHKRQPHHNQWKLGAKLQKRIQRSKENEKVILYCKLEFYNVYWTLKI